MDGKLRVCHAPECPANELSDQLWCSHQALWPTRTGPSGGEEPVDVCSHDATQLFDGRAPADEGPTDHDPGQVEPVYCEQAEEADTRGLVLTAPQVQEHRDEGAAQEISGKHHCARQQDCAAEQQRPRKVRRPVHERHRLKLHAVTETVRIEAKVWVWALTQSERKQQT
jgi:hypothetical protein